MRRRFLLLIAVAALSLAADGATDVVALVTSGASGLSAGKPELFLENFDPAMPGFDKFRASVLFLVQQADVSNYIEVLDNQGDDTARTMELDWVLRIDHKSRQSADPLATTRRQKQVKCRWQNQGKKWKIVEFSPLDLFEMAK